MSTIEDVLTALRRVIRATDLHSKHLEKTAGLTAPQLLLLRLLRDGELSPGSLARQMSLSQATVTTIIDRLERRGLVTRRRGESDKRKVYADLTAAGKRALEGAPRPLQEHFVRRFQELHDWEQSMILSALQRVASMMDAEALDAAPLLDIGAPDRAAGTGTPATPAQDSVD
jgi:DNA-binding MarR family transcriptional regulator